jgi:hypothetical protein
VTRRLDDRMKAHVADGDRLRTRPQRHRYRLCSGCGIEWPADRTQCPECLRWLGDGPLERVEWRLFPSGENDPRASGYEVLGGSALCLQVVGTKPSRSALAAVDKLLGDMVAPSRDVSCIPDEGWLIWSSRGLRESFLDGLRVRDDLVEIRSGIEQALEAGARLRWGIWVDQYLLPCDPAGRPVVRSEAARAIFDFEPDGLLLASEAAYRANRRWESFVCIPRRLIDGCVGSGYRPMGGKRPSALDHRSQPDASPFVGRSREIELLDGSLRASTGQPAVLAIIADAGSGKSRLIREWLSRHPGLRPLYAAFSVFGGDMTSFAAQLVELPPARLDQGRLAAEVARRIEALSVDVLVLDDLHWADAESAAFLRSLLRELSSTSMTVVLAARPSGELVARRLAPSVVVALEPLVDAVVERLALQLIDSKTVAAEAVSLSRGNPLFVEQFAAWAAETGYAGGGQPPSTLHQVIAARISLLAKVRLPAIQDRIRWSWQWGRQDAIKELDRLEDEIGLWLDRLETGDYADQVEAARYLLELERLDVEIFLARAVAGSPRLRSGRLREAIERLLIGSADRVLEDMEARAKGAGAADKANLARDARRAGDSACDSFRWDIAARFYRIALSVAEGADRRPIEDRLAQCLSRTNDTDSTTDAAVQGQALVTEELAEHPMVDALRLPELWFRLGALYDSPRYFLRAADAAEAINDAPMARRAREKATGENPQG